jgi:hypothetical protein
MSSQDKEFWKVAGKVFGVVGGGIVFLYAGLFLLRYILQ